MLSSYELYCESQEKLKRVEFLLNNALNYIFDVTGYNEEEYLRILKTNIHMNKQEIEEEKINMGYEE